MRFAQAATAVLRGKVFTRDVVMARIVEGLGPRVLPLVQSITVTMAAMPLPEGSGEEWNIDGQCVTAAEEFLTSFVASHNALLFELAEATPERFGSSLVTPLITVLSLCLLASLSCSMCASLSFSLSLRPLLWSLLSLLPAIPTWYRFLLW